MAAAGLYYDKKKKSDKKHEPAGDSENEDDDGEERSLVIKRESNRSIRSSSPTTCVEDEDHMASTDETLVAYTVPVREKPASVPWPQAYDADQKAIRILSPSSTLDYGARIRTRQLAFTVTASLQGGLLTAGPEGDHFSAVKPCESLRALLFDCESSKCEHVALPLRIRQTGSSLLHSATTVPVRVQLWTNEFRYSASEKERIKPWLPENSSETKTHYGDSKAPVVTDTAYSLSLAPGRSNDYSTSPRLLYEAPKSHVTPALMDLQWLLGCDTSQFMKYVRKSAGTALTVAYLSQPDQKTNKAPNWLSYFVTTQQLLGSSRGSTVHKRAAFTHVDVDTKEALFKFAPEFYKHAIGQIQASQSDQRYAMNITGGMWATFHPTDIKAWNAYLQLQMDKSSADKVFMSVEFAMDYVVLGPVR